MKVLDLFSGIGGFSLGLDRAGFETVAFCEIEKYPRGILEKHWPGVPIFEDIRKLTADIYGNLLYTDDNGDVYYQEIGIDMGAKKSNRYDDAVSFYEQGMSIGDCAEYFGISRQAMHDILKRRGCKFRPKLKYGKDNHFHRGGTPNGRKRAGHLLEKAVKKGVIIQKVRCEDCGQTKTFEDGRTGIQAHHDDYSKPLEVRWLCQECHHEWHKNNQAKEFNEPADGTINVVCGGFP